LKKGDFGAYGEAQQRLEDALKRAADAETGKKSTKGTSPTPTPVPPTPTPVPSTPPPQGT
jgi:hypothetical protein